MIPLILLAFSYEKQGLAYEALSKKHAQLQKDNYLLQTDLDLLRKQQKVIQPEPGSRPMVSPRLTALTIQSAGGSLALGDSIGSKAQSARISRLTAENRALADELAVERSRHSTPELYGRRLAQGAYTNPYYTRSAPGDGFRLRD